MKKHIYWVKQFITKQQYYRQYCASLGFIMKLQYIIQCALDFMGTTYTLHRERREEGSIWIMESLTQQSSHVSGWVRSGWWCLISLNLKHFFNLFDLYSRKVIVLQQDSHSNSVDYPQRGSVSFWNLVAHGRQCFIQTRTNVIIYALLREEQLFCQLMSHLEKCFFLPIYSS